MPKRSAVLMMYRKRGHEIEVFLAHPGGPFWAKKNMGAWSIPKGELEQETQVLEEARREFHEETGFVAQGEFLDLGTVKQTSGKIVAAWAFEGDCDPAQLVSNLCRIEWPPRSGRTLEFPEADRGRWFSPADAANYILKSQRPLLEMLLSALA